MFDALFLFWVSFEVHSPPFHSLSFIVYFALNCVLEEKTQKGSHLSVPLSTCGSSLYLVTDDKTHHQLLHSYCPRAPFNEGHPAKYLLTKKAVKRINELGSKGRTWSKSPNIDIY